MKTRILTMEEKNFSERNMGLLKYWEKTEYYGTAAIAFLEAVQKWHEKEELHKYCFSTIASNAIRYAISAEKSKEQSICCTTSLDADIYEDYSPLQNSITYQNIQFVDYISREEDEMKVSYDVDTSNYRRYHLSEETKLLAEFIKGKHKNMVLTYDDSKEAKKKTENLRSFLKNHKLTTIKISKSDCSIIVERIGGK